MAASARDPQNHQARPLTSRKLVPSADLDPDIPRNQHKSIFFPFQHAFQLHAASKTLTLPGACLHHHIPWQHYTHRHQSQVPAYGKAIGGANSGWSKLSVVRNSNHSVSFCQMHTWITTSPGNSTRTGTGPYCPAVASVRLSLRALVSMGPCAAAFAAVTRTRSSAVKS